MSGVTLKRFPEVVFAPHAQPLPDAKLRGLWLSDDRYTPLRNAAWLVGNQGPQRREQPQGLDRRGARGAPAARRWAGDRRRP